MRHSDDLEGMAVQRERPADDVPSSAVFPLPEVVAEDGRPGEEVGAARLRICSQRGFVKLVVPSPIDRRTISPGFRTGRERRSTASMRLKMPVLAPMPSASDATATTVKPR